MIEKLILGILTTLTVVLGLMGILFIGAMFSGTILWMLYPHIHSLFPSAAANGIIAQDLSWWSSVCVVWIFGLLVKGSSSSSSSSKIERR